MDENLKWFILEENDSDSNQDDDNNSDQENHVGVQDEKNYTAQEGDSDNGMESRRTFSDFYLRKDNKKNGTKLHRQWQ